MKQLSLVRLSTVPERLLADRISYGHYILLKNDLPISEYYLNDTKTAWHIKGGGDWLFPTKAEAITRAYDTHISHPSSPWTQAAELHIKRNYPEHGSPPGNEKRN